MGKPPDSYVTSGEIFTSVVYIVSDEDVFIWQPNPTFYDKVRITYTYSSLRDTV